MAQVLVIHEAADKAFVEGRLLKPLPALGFERWYSTVALDTGAAGRTSLPTAMTKSAAILVVVSSAASLETHRARVAEARKTATPVIVVCASPVAVNADDKIWSTLPLIAAADHDDGLWHELAAVLPLPESSPRRTTGGEPIAWDTAVFSRLLRDGVSCHDYHRGDALVSTFARLLKAKAAPHPYPDEAAVADLNTLRRERQFSLMSRFAEAVLKSGVTNFAVRRLYAQSLIELADFDRALKVLKKIVAEAPAKHPESYEARGLIGRVYKQRYVNAPDDRRARSWLAQAIDAYKSVYDEDPEQVWHGVNAASLLIRGSRDGSGPEDLNRAHDIARNVTATLERREKALGKDEQLSAFDCA